MKVAGSSILHATPDKVWEAINDPAVLAGVIPGCDAFTEVGEGHFKMTVTLGVAAIKGSYSGEVKLYDKVEPSSLTMRATGAGGPGTVDTTVAVTLADVGDGTTKLDYAADAVVGGMAGGVGQRVLTSVAKKTAGLFFSAIDDVLTGKKPAGKPAAPAGTAAEPAVAAGGELVASGVGVQPAVGAAPLAVSGGATSPIALAAAALFGAFSALVGVLIGSRIARRD